MRTEAWLRSMSAFVLVGVFAAGAVFGAGLVRWTQPPPGRWPPLPGGGRPAHVGGGAAQAMTRELGLDAAQVLRLEALTDARRGELETITREVQGRVRDVLHGIEEDMRPSLRPEQIEKLAGWRARRPPPPLGGMGPPPGRHPPGGPPGGGPPGGGPPPGGAPQGGGPVE